ncbi:hypothetical protein D3C71_22850 [compost metagenome]
MRPFPMKKLAPIFLLLVLLSVFLATSATAAPAKTSKGPAATDIEKGWFYFDDPPPPVEPTPEEPAPKAPPAPPPKSAQEKCSKKDSWTAECGFVNPGEDFDFQAKQRDALLERMSVSNNDPKAVEAMQYYMRWVLERTSQVTNLWWYNMVQNPELDPTAAQPVSAMGLRLMTEVRKGAQSEVFDLVKDEGGMFVYFSRSDCVFCHQMSEPLRVLASRTGIPVRNASLDAKCMPGFEAGCLAGPRAVDAAQALQVGTVPTVFLYVQPNTWIRIATGITDTESMTTRAMQFFSAYRNALLKGVNNAQDGRPSVDFDTAAPTGNTSTGIPTNGSGGGTVSQDVISDLLGQRK